MSEGPTLDQLNLVVSDMDATIAFYRRLGLTIPDTDPTFQAHHRNAQQPDGIDLDFDSSEFARHWDKGWQSSRVVIGFKVPTRGQVDSIYTELTEAAYVGQQPPYDAFWGARYAIIEDPDGNAVGIMSPIDPGRRHAPDFP